MKFNVKDEVFTLQQNEADSQAWMLVKEVRCSRAGKPSDGTELLALVCVYVDDFLVMAPNGPVRDAMVKALEALREFGAEKFLTPEALLSFLGIDWYRRRNGDIYLSQERFIKELLEKNKMDNCRSIQSITMDKPPEADDPPTPVQFTELQSHAGAFRTWRTGRHCWRRHLRNRQRGAANWHTRC